MSQRTTTTVMRNDVMNFDPEWTISDDEDERPAKKRRVEADVSSFDMLQGSLQSPQGSVSTRESLQASAAQ